MATKYVIGETSRCDRYVRLYKNQRQFVWRVSPKTATHFENIAAAEKIVGKFCLKTCAIYSTADDGKTLSLLTA